MIAGFIAIVVAFFLAQYETKKDLLDDDIEPNQEPDQKDEPETVDIPAEVIRDPEVKDVANEPGTIKTE
jgi:hypothetical protein